MSDMRPSEREVVLVDGVLARVVLRLYEARFAVVVLPNRIERVKPPYLPSPRRRIGTGRYRTARRAKRSSPQRAVFADVSESVTVPGERPDTVVAPLEIGWRSVCIR